MLLGVCLAFGCGGDDAAELLVDLRTDYAPGSEFDGVRVEVADASGAVVGRGEQVVENGDDYLAGYRVAEVGGLAEGAYRVTVRVFLDGAARAERVIALDHPGGTFAITALVTRDCEGVVCPGAGDDPSLAACVGGRCVAENCTPTTPELCPAPQCMGDTECSSPLACARSVCVDGACLEVLDDGLCGADESCVRDVGCAPDGGPVGDCATNLECDLFDADCLSDLGRRCAMMGFLDDGRASLVIYDPDTGAHCDAESVDPRPGLLSGLPALFGAGFVTSSNLGAMMCGQWSMSLDTGLALREPSLCGLPAPRTADALAYVESVTPPDGVIHSEGEADVPFTAPTPWGFLYALGDGVAALEQDTGAFQLIDLTTGTLGAVITEPERSSGLWPDGANGYYWLTGLGLDKEIVRIGESGGEIARVPVTGLPPLDVDAQYVGLGCAF